MGQHDAATEPLAELGKPVILVVEDELLERDEFALNRFGILESALF